MRRPWPAALGAGLVALLTVVPGAASEHPADVCLALGDPSTAGWPALVEAVEAVVAGDQTLFPAPSVTTTGSRLEVHAGHPDLPAAEGGDCLLPGSDWSARFSRGFLVEGAELMLEQAERTPGFESSIELGWFPDEDRVRSLLEFSGPFGIPSGSCWVDDRLSIDTGAGLAVASGERGMDVSPFGDVVCGRFYDSLTRGGAGEQALNLLPAELVLGDGRALRLVAETVSVLEDAIVLGGSVRQD